MPFGVAGNARLEVEAAAGDLWEVIGHGPTNTTTASAGSDRKEGSEPRSVLDHGRSPSPPTSVSTLSSSLGSAGAGDSAGLTVASGNPWLPAQDATCSAMADAAALGIPDQSYLRWVMGEIEESSPSTGLKRQELLHMLLQQVLPPEFEAGEGGGGFGLLDPAFSSIAALLPTASAALVASAGELSEVDCGNGDAGDGYQFPRIPPSAFLPFQETSMEGKLQCFSPSLLLNPQQVHFHQQQDLVLPPPSKRHYSMVDPRCQILPGGLAFCDTEQDPLPWRHQQQRYLESLCVCPYHLQQRGGDDTAWAAAEHHQRQEDEATLVDQLVEAAALVEAGNFANAGVVLARLNHQLSPVGKPLIRSAFYCKEALQSIVTTKSNSTPPMTSPPLRQSPASMVLSTPVDVVLKLSAYRAFSEISPILQFTNFTCTQALLEKLDGYNRIHIIDFDVGVGGQWSSFMEEFAQRRCGVGAAILSLRITAIASLSAYRSFELGLTGENLSHFAGGLNIRFEFNILNSDPLDLSSLRTMLQSDEAIAVNLPISAAYPSMPNILRFVKQLSPKIVVSIDHGWDHNGLVFSHHFFQLLQSATMLLDSIDGAGISPVTARKIERYLLQPRIENSVLGHHEATVKSLPWQTLFSAAGFTAVPFSNFTEAQADCLLKRTQVRGFFLEKHQASLLLCWKHGVLVSVSAWKC